MLVTINAWIDTETMKKIGMSRFYLASFINEKMMKNQRNECTITYSKDFEQILRFQGCWVPWPKE